MEEDTEKQEFDVECCPTEDMQADFLTKPLQGEPFEKMFNWLMGIERSSGPIRFQMSHDKNQFGPVQRGVKANQ